MLSEYRFLFKLVCISHLTITLVLSLVLGLDLGEKQFPLFLRQEIFLPGKTTMDMESQAWSRPKEIWSCAMKQKDALEKKTGKIESRARSGSQGDKPVN